MEHANTDRPKARSTRKGKPPETSSEDSYNADRGKPQWSVVTGRALPLVHLTALSATGGATEQRVIFAMGNRCSTQHHE